MQTQAIKKILLGDLPLKIQLMQFLVLLKKKFLLRKKGAFQGLTNREGLLEYHISASQFDPNKRKFGISGFARLKNGAEFLEKTIESHIPFFDEIILVDNNSEDATWEICLSLEKKYPEIIKTYRYLPEVYRLGSEAYKQVAEDSVHGMSYYYNRVLAKTTYTYAIKIDDDHLVIPEVMSKLTKDIKTKGLQHFLLLPLYNIIQEEERYFLPYQAPFAGLFSDFGFFPVSQKTYFVKDKKCENFLHNLKVKTGPLCFFHLKFLKTDQGTINYVGKIKGEIQKNITGELFPLPKKLSEVFIRLFQKNG